MLPTESGWYVLGYESMFSVYMWYIHEYQTQYIRMGGRENDSKTTQGDEI